ncbi:gp436 family protein [Celeribacter sp.]|uniref:gp436 family protein n=1 Tax=Celeribacter sp. TaxID=1890673 RepID=UPI003A938F4F
MTYATQSDIEELYGSDILHIADRDGDGVPEADAITRACVSASAEIDTHLHARYALPLPEVPEYLRQLAVDIAIYRLAQTADVLSEEMRTRYEDALAALRRIAEGKAALVFSPTDEDGDGVDDDTTPRPIVVGGPEREFTREKMKGL